MQGKSVFLWETISQNIRYRQQDSEVIFITTPDSAIAQVWEELKALQIRHKIVCHCSRILSSEIFSGKTAYNCSGYSIHPLLAVCDKLHSYKEFSDTIFTIEDDAAKKPEMTQLIESCGNQVLPLRPGAF